MKAIITAADPRHRNLPFQTITDRTGRTLPLIGLHLEELAKAGIESVAIVHHGDDGGRYEELVEQFSVPVVLLPQKSANGFGDAIYQAKDFVGNDPFVLLVCDHVFLSRNPDKNCIEQLVSVYESVGKPVSAVQSTHESQVTSFGVVGAEPISQKTGLYKVKEVREKPTPTEAELHLRVPGNRAGYYLGFFGIHILEKDIFSLLEQEKSKEERFGLSSSLNELARKGNLVACLIDGRRYDLEADYGILHAQLALALTGLKRETVLSDLVKILADA